jgi:formyl-CoA transferase
MQSPLALCNLRVIELGQLIAGPFAAKTLADFGADVIKIEPPNSGDPSTQMALTQRWHIGVVANSIA